MSILDKGNCWVDVYPEVATRDRDGNTFTHPSDKPKRLWVMWQAHGESGTAARRQEQMAEGFFSENVARMRVRREDAGVKIGPQSYLMKDGERWEVFGYPTEYRMSRRTGHFDYTMRRS